MVMDGLKSRRERLDQLDEQILDLLQERNRLVGEVAQRKREQRLPVFIASRETEKSESFRAKAVARGLDPDWAEDFLRMIMSASRASQSADRFPRATETPCRILFIGGNGRMGRLFRFVAENSGHITYSIDRGDWYRLGELRHELDMVIVTVPIEDTVRVITRLQGRLKPDTVLADFTSHKTEPMAAMLATHPGPVLGMHPMHGPDVPNLSKQLMVVCPGRRAEQAEWFIQQCRLWGMRVIERDAEEHDRAMDLVQGLRHFVALLHGSFMRRHDLKPADMLDLSSPIYRAELMMTGRIFAQDPALYADIVFSSEQRRELLLAFLEHHESIAAMVRNNDRAGFIREFEAVTDFFGEFATQALQESSYLINRLAERFS